MNFPKKLILLFFVLLLKKSYALDLNKNLNFHIQYGNMQIGKFQVEIENKNNNIVLTAKSFSEGLISNLYNYQGNLFYKSSIKNNKWLPEIYVTKGNLNGKDIISKIDWTNKSKKFTYHSEPKLDLKKFYKINPDSLTNTIDPITSIIKLIHNLKYNKTCDIKFRVFDGRRRYNLIFKDLEIHYLYRDRPRSYEGNVKVCGIKLIPIGGHRIKSKWKPNQDKFEDIKIFFSVSDNTIVPVRVSLKRWFGKIVARLIKNGN